MSDKKKTSSQLNKELQKIDKKIYEEGLKNGDSKLDMEKAKKMREQLVEGIKKRRQEEMSNGGKRTTVKGTKEKLSDAIKIKGGKVEKEGKTIIKEVTQRINDSNTMVKGTPEKIKSGTTVKGEKLIGDRDKKVIKGVTPKVAASKDVTKTGKEFIEHVAKKRHKLLTASRMKKLAGKIPGIGAIIGIYEGLKSGDVSAATPIGPSGEFGTDKSIEDPTSQEFRDRMERLRKESIKKKLK